MLKYKEYHLSINFKNEIEMNRIGGFNKREKSGNLCEFRYWNHFNKGCSS